MTMLDHLLQAQQHQISYKCFFWERINIINNIQVLMLVNFGEQVACVQTSSPVACSETISGPLEGSC